MNLLPKLCIWLNIISVLSAIWIQSDTPMLRSDASFAVGADIDSDTIFIIGGDFESKQIFEYSITHNTWTDLGRYGSVFQTNGIGQFWTQQHDMIYVLLPKLSTTTTLGVFNMTSKEYTTKWSNIIIESSIASDCIASNTQYLFVVGGTHDNALEDVQILSLSTQQWLDNIPSMNQRRGSAACIAHNDYLWVFSGKGTPTNERISLLDDITLNTWIYTLDELSNTIEGLRAVAWYNTIYVIGGCIDHDTALNTIHIVDASTTSIQLSSDTLLYAVYAAGVVVHNSVLYVFGGSDCTGNYLSSWMYYEFDVITPQIYIDGPSVFSITNKNFDGMLVLNAIVSFNHSLHYTLEWDVTCDICADIDPLSTYLTAVSMNDSMSDTVSFWATDYLEVGARYIFTVSVSCLGSVKCAASAQLSMDYKQADIICQIASADISLGDMTLYYLKQLNYLYLDGNTFSYDPDHGVNDKQHLFWDWECLMSHNNNVAERCDLLLYDTASAQRSTNHPSSYVHFEDIDQYGIDAEGIYQFTFTMIVSDLNDNTRICTDRSNVTVTINNTALHYIILAVQIMATQHIVNIGDTLRLMSHSTDMISNAYVNNHDTEHSFIYEWTENNNMLTASQLETLNTNIAGGNLVIEPYQLDVGFYTFELANTMYFGDEIVGGGTGSIYIEIKGAPTITSFIVYPNCANVVLRTLDDVFATSYTLQVGANSAYEPLSYAFSISNGMFLHHNQLNDGTLSDIMLPIGVFNIMAHVYDAYGAVSTQNYSCHIQRSLDNYLYATNGNCVSYKSILNHSNVNSSVAVHEFVISSSFLYIDYIATHLDEEGLSLDDSDMQCVQNMLNDTLDSIYSHFDIFKSQNIFCPNDFSLQLSSLMTAWMNLRTRFLSEDSLDSLLISLSKLQSIIIQILDPCLYITKHIQHISTLTVSDDSVITGSPSIYHQNTDITSQLSRLLLRYEDHLHTFASSCIYFMKYIVAMDAYIDADHDLKSIVFQTLELVQKSLYIAQLAKLSVSIAGETSSTKGDAFELYLVRSGANVNRDINITVDGIDIMLNSTDLLAYLTECNDTQLCYVDVIANGFISSRSKAVVVDDDDANAAIDVCEHQIGSVSANRVDINIVGENTTMLHDNVSLIFSNTSGDTECVWLQDEVNNIWSTKGCEKKVNSPSKHVECICNHLTVFATMNKLQHDPECIQFDSEWHMISLLAAFVFMMIMVAVMLQIHPFCRSQHKSLLCKEKSLLVYVLIVVLCVINISISVSFYILEDAQKEDKHAIAHWIIILLSIPLFIYFVIFSIILYAWAIVVHSVRAQDEEKVQRRLGVSVYVSCIVVFICLVIQLLLIPFGVWEDIYSYALLTWCALLIIAALVYTVYGYLMLSVLYQTAVAVRKATYVGSDLSLARKLLICALSIWVFFILELVLHLILFFDHKSFDESLWIRALDLALNVCCVAIICWMFHSSIERLRNEHECESWLDKHEACTRCMHSIGLKTRSNIGDIPSNDDMTSAEESTVPRTKDKLLGRLMKRKAKKQTNINMVESTADTATKHDTFLNRFQSKKKHLAVHQEESGITATASANSDGGFMDKLRIKKAQKLSDVSDAEENENIPAAETTADETLFNRFMHKKVKLKQESIALEVDETEKTKDKNVFNRWKNKKEKVEMKENQDTLNVKETKNNTNNTLLDRLRIKKGKKVSDVSDAEESEERETMHETTADNKLFNRFKKKVSDIDTFEVQQTESKADKFLNRLMKKKHGNVMEGSATATASTPNSESTQEKDKKGDSSVVTQMSKMKKLTKRWM